MKPNEQLFAYQKEELFQLEQEKHYEKLAKKQARRLWIESLNGRPKRTVYYTLMIKSTCDGLYVGPECIRFSNREIEYVN